MAQQGSTTLTVTEAAQRIGVSTATIRNWVKSGELQRAEEGGVTVESIELCRQERVGKARLVSRANKRYKAQQKSHLATDSGVRYDESLSESQRNIDGVYYTPKRVVRDMLSIVEGVDLSDKLLLDPCCGSGNFLVEAIEMGFKPENIYGCEIDPVAAKIARRRVFELTGYRSRNIVCGDFLKLAEGHRRRYDYCVTNPPWGQKLTLRERRAFAKRYGLRGSVDSLSMFLLASMDVLREGGVLSFLLPESFLVVRSFESVRRYLFDYKVDRLVDYGRVFRSLLTSASAITLTKSAADDADEILCEAAGKSHLRSRKSFLCNPSLTLNIWATAADAEVVEQLYAKPHITLAGGAKWGLGIVTGNNAKYTSQQACEGYREVVRGADILPETPESFGVGQIRRDEMYIGSDLANYQQVAPLELYESPEKIIYKFISQRLSFVLDREQLFTLNSANILVLNDDFALSAEQLVRVLNSDFMTWLYRTIFHARKVLRGDLERLPLYPEYFEAQEQFDEKSYLEWLNVKINI